MSSVRVMASVAPCVTEYVPRRWRTSSALADRLLLALVLEMARLGEWRGRPQVVDGPLGRGHKGTRAQEPSLRFEVAIGGRRAPERGPTRVRARYEHFGGPAGRAGRGARGAELECSAGQGATRTAGGGRCRMDACVHVHGASRGVASGTAVGLSERVGLREDGGNGGDDGNDGYLQLTSRIC